MSGQLTKSISHINISGHVQVFRNGELIREGHNLVVQAGLNFVAGRMVGTPTAMSHMASGTGGTSPTLSDTELDTESHRVALDSHVALNNSVTYVATFTGQNVATETIQEFGILNAASVGTMLCRFLCPGFDWKVSDTLVVSWSIDIGGENA